MDFDNGVAILNNTNHLIGHFEGCDGLKTGFTYQAGFNVTTTAKRGNMRLIAVILGAPSNAQRFAQAAKVMEWGFDQFTAVSLVRSGQPLPIHVQVHEGPLIQPVAATDLKMVVRKSDAAAVKVVYDIAPADQRADHDGRTARASDRAGRGTGSNRSDGDKPGRVHATAYTGRRGIQRGLAAAEQ